MWTPEKATAPHSSTLAWKIPWAKEPGRLQSMGSQRVGHDWATSLSLFTFMHWRRKWQSTPVFLPGESQGRGSLVGCRLWGRTESDTTEVTQQQQQHVDPLLHWRHFLKAFALWIRHFREYSHYVRGRGVVIKASQITETDKPLLSVYLLWGPITTHGIRVASNL